MNRMFTRIMAVVLVAIVLLTGSLSVMSYFTLRGQRVDERLEYLCGKAEDIAYLAADYLSGGVGSLFFYQDSARHLNWKVQEVYDEFGAYIAVVDRWGNQMDNLEMAWSNDPDFVASLSGEEISRALQKVLTGETIRVQSRVGDAQAFTVGVPFLRYGTVAGAVLIQTRAQTIQSGMEDLIWKMGAITLLVLAISGAAIGLYVRSIMKPLTELTAAAGAMAEGNFDVQVGEEGGGEEIQQLSRAFNSMREKLRTVESGRREFVANVSHELRSPITSIRGFAEGMADGVIPPEEHPKYLRLVADESKRLSALVGELLELSRLEREDAKLEYSDFDINEMLRRAVIRRMNDLDEKELETDCDFGEEPCFVRADSARIEEVVINLLDNAIKFVPPKGKILLRTRRSTDGVEVIVWDNGPEVPEEDRKKIFDRFYTSDKAHTSGKGTGLGLSICQRVMEMHGREIVLLSEEETRRLGGDEKTGTAFRFSLKEGDRTSKADNREE